MKKVIVAAAAAATLLTPALATASAGHAGAKHVTVHICVNADKKHGKARLAKHCKTGEKSLTLHLVVPGGAAGATGATGPQGPAGSNGTGLTLKDANGNSVGTFVSYNGFGSAEVMLNDGSIETVDMTTGQIGYGEPFSYATSDCSGPAYSYSNYGSQSPFAAYGHTAVGDPLYTTSASTQTITEGSYLGVDGSCQTDGHGMSPMPFYLVAPTGKSITIGNFSGPLTLTK